MDILPHLVELVSVDSEEKKQQLKSELAAYLNDLALHNFPSLVQLLYRVDVSEKKIKEVLQNSPGENAGDLIAHLLIERQQQKQAAKKNQNPTGPSEEERW